MNAVTTDWNRMADIRCKLHTLFMDPDMELLNTFMNTATNQALTNGIVLTNTETVSDISSDTFKMSFSINDDGIGIADGCSVRTAETVLYVELMNTISNVLKFSIGLLSRSNPNIYAELAQTIDNINNQSSIAVLFDIMIYNDHFDVTI